MLSFDRLDTTLDLDENGLPVAYDIQFQGDATVAHTYYLVNAGDPNLHLYIDVDHENTPIAMSLVHPPSRINYVKVSKTDPVFRHEVSRAYAFASVTAKWAEGTRRLVFFDMASLEEGKNIVRDAARSMQDLEKFDCVGAGA